MTLLVSGASGKLGRAVVQHLEAAATGLRVIAGSRTPSSTHGPNVEARLLDFDMPMHELVQAFSGATRVLLIATTAPELERARHQVAAVRAAVEAGATRVVLVSSPKPEPPSPVVAAATDWLTEQVLGETGVDCTFLRNGWFQQYLVRVLQEALRTGVLLHAAGDAKAAFINREDCAKAAAACLLRDDVPAGAVELTGPTAVSFEEAASIAQRVTGHAIEVRSLYPEELREQLLRAGMPPRYAGIVVGHHHGMRMGKFAQVTDSYRALTDERAVEPSAVIEKVVV